MKLNFAVSEEDYIQFNVCHYENSGSVKRQRTLMAMLGVLALPVWEYLNTGGVSMITSVVSMTFWAMWLIFGRKLYRKAMAFLAGMQVKKGAGREFIGERTLELLEDKIRMVWPQKTVDTSYETIEKITSDGKRLYVYTGSMSALIIPLSAFADEGEKQEFFRLLKEKSANLDI